MKNVYIFGLIYHIWIAYVSSDIIHYNQHILQPDQPEYIVIPKYRKQDVPNWSPGRGHSLIDLSELSLQVDCSLSSLADCENTSVKFELLMFLLPSDKTWSSYWPDGAFCCNADEVEDGHCDDDALGGLIVPPTLPGYYTQQVEVNSKLPKVLHEESAVFRHEILETGEYVIILAVCNEHSGPIAIDGRIESIDPYGYLPANLFGDLPFYGALSLAYCLLGIIWMVSCALYSNQLIPLHFWISGVLALGMFETTMLLINYIHWNDVGRQSLTINLFSVIFGTIKRALSRMLVQFISLGYGIVRPSIGEDYNRVLSLGGMYCVLSLIYSIASSLPQSSKAIERESEIDFLSGIVLLLAAIDTTFYVWIFTSLSNLVTSLAARKQGAKYILYRDFRTVLYVSLFFTIIWGLYRSLIMYGDNIESWQYQWTVDALWELMYFVVFVAIAYLWAPSKNSLRYAYSIELVQLEDDEEYNSDSNLINSDKSLDDEYGGQLQDDGDPFQGKGALDPAMAISKKA